MNQRYPIGMLRVVLLKLLNNTAGKWLNDNLSRQLTTLGFWQKSNF